MALNFPPNPTTGQRYLNYVFTGVAWTVSANQLGEAPATGQAYVRDGATNQWLLEPANPNKLLNPFMEIDQANEGATINVANARYVADGFQAQQSINGGVINAVRQSTGGPVSYPFNILMNVATAVTSVGATSYSMFLQVLEASDCYDTQWGTANAQPITVAFWANCTANVAGTYYMSVRNATANRSYVVPFTLTGNTWQLFVFTIPGDTAGTWPLSGNTGSITVSWAATAGTTFQTPNLNTWQTGNFLAGTGISNAYQVTAGASFLLGACKLEVGSTATPMLRTSFQQELARCQRYYEKSYNVGVVPGSNVGTSGNSQGIMLAAALGANGLQQTIGYRVTKRSSPTVTPYTYAGGIGVSVLISGSWTGTTSQFFTNGTQMGHAFAVSATGLTALAWDYVADARL